MFLRETVADLLMRSINNEEIVGLHRAWLLCSRFLSALIVASE